MHRRGVFLEVVRRQPVVVRRRRRFRRTPRSCATPGAGTRSARRELCRRTRERAAEPPGEQRRCQPQQQDRRGRRQHFGPRMPAGTAPWQRAGTVQSTSSAGKSRRSAPPPASSCRWRPLEQPPAGDQHPQRGAQDRVHADAGLERQAGQRERRLRERAARPRAGSPARCWRSTTSSGLRSNSTSEAHAAGTSMIASTASGPEPRRRQEGPAEQQQQPSARGRPGCGAGCRKSSTATGRERIVFRAAAVAGTRRRSQPASCQSPRIQRCRRLTSAL